MPTPPDHTLIEATDACVRCGLCLPPCPTFQTTQHEAQSPRGRIELMAALAKKTLSFGPVIEKHLNSCERCGVCERVCPLHLPFESWLKQSLQTHQKSN